jgi:hypothetical protein
MSFEGEFASYEPFRRLRESAKVLAFEGQIRIHKPDEERKSIAPKLLPADDLQKSTIEPDLVLAFDGGELIGKAENGFPGAELGYLTVASVLIDLKRVAELRKDDFILPADFKETEKVESIETVFPGANVVYTGEKDAKSSLRRRLFEEFGQVGISFSEETLLETYEYLLNLALPSLKKHPSKNPVDESLNLIYRTGSYECPATKAVLYSTDALRIHELMRPWGTNGEMFGQIRSVMEKLWLVHILRAFEKKGWLSTLKRVAFIVDGPLAVFSTSAWLAKPIAEELKRINELQKAINEEDILLIGIEKSGTFLNHLIDLDTTVDGTNDFFPRQHALLIADDYIKKNIRLSESDKPYGLDTYFGRKIFYKSLSGQLLVPNIAHFRVFATREDAANFLGSADKGNFPRLGDVTRLLDQLVSSRYPNSISPLVSAHAEAAIPMNLGKRIFDDLARELRKRSETL